MSSNKPAYVCGCFSLYIAVLGVCLIGCQDPGVNTEEISFVAFGDQGTGDANQQAVADAMEEQCSLAGCDFAITLGDNFYPSGVTSVNDPQWQSKFESPYVALEFPFFISLGNHDYGGGGGADLSKGVHQVAYGNINSKWALPMEYHHFEAGDALFLALGTNLIVVGSDNAISDQASEFSNAIRDTSRGWNVAFGHHPYMSDGPHGNASNYDGIAGKGISLKTFFEDYLCGTIDLFLFGHDHSLQVLPGTVDCPGLFVVAGGGGAALTGFPARDGNLILFRESAWGFAHVRVNSRQIELTMFDINGSARYHHTIDAQN